MTASSPRVFLFLQGHPSLFWRNLAAGLVAEGHRVLKVNFSSADWLFWWRKGAVNFKSPFAKWEPWLRGYLIAEGVTDIFYYADQLPYHVTAREVARDLGVKSWAIEFGYLRPDWLTLEPEAMGKGSKFPRDPVSLRQIAEGLPDPDTDLRFNHAFNQEAFFEVSYNLIQTFGRPFFPFYYSDEYYWPVFDYLYWLRELAREPRYRREVRAALTTIGNRPFNLVAMQLQPDYQIRGSSPYDHLSEFLTEVITSFEQNAPADRHLLIKLHPFDNGMENWPRWIDKIAARIRGRVHLIRGGNLGDLLRKSEGAVYVNSTVGLHAIQQHVPSIALGSAVFDVPGLTHQRGLDSFWQNPDPVDPDFVEIYIRALSTIQIKGSFFSKEGQDHAIAGIAARFHEGDVQSAQG